MFRSTWKTPTISEYEKWREWLAKQEMLTPPGYLVSSLVPRRPWMTTFYAFICATMRVHQLLCTGADPGIFVRGVQPSENFDKQKKKKKKTPRKRRGRGRGLSVTILLYLSESEIYFCHWNSFYSRYLFSPGKNTFEMIVLALYNV